MIPSERWRSPRAGPLRAGRTELPEVRWSHVGQSTFETESQGARLQVPKPFLRRRNLAITGDDALRNE